MVGGPEESQIELQLDSLPDSINMGNRYLFEDIKTIPQEWRRDLLNLVLGSHDSALQEKVNRFRPVQVFNLSITPPNIIEQTHERMRGQVTMLMVDNGKKDDATDCDGIRERRGRLGPRANRMSLLWRRRAPHSPPTGAR